jgi:hypothetical protein
MDVFEVVDVGDEGLAKEEDEVLVDGLDVVFEDLAPCPGIQLPLHISYGQLCHVFKPFGNNGEIVLEAEFVIQVLFRCDFLGFFQIALARADTHPVPINLKRSLPTLAVAALLHFGSAIQQHMRIVVQLGHQHSSTAFITY